MDAETPHSHRIQNAEWILKEPALISETQYSEYADQGNAAALCDRSALPFIHDQDTSVLLFGELDRFCLTLIQAK